MSPQGNSGCSHLFRPFRALCQFPLLPPGLTPRAVLLGPFRADPWSAFDPFESWRHFNSTWHRRHREAVEQASPPRSGKFFQLHLAQAPPRSGGTGQPRAQALGNSNDLNQSPERAIQPALLNIRRLRPPMVRLQGRGFPPSLMEHRKNFVYKSLESSRPSWFILSSAPSFQRIGQYREAQLQGVAAG